jgi:hypothetical protein
MATGLYLANVAMPRAFIATTIVSRPIKRVDRAALNGAVVCVHGNETSIKFRFGRR